MRKKLFVKAFTQYYPHDAMLVRVYVRATCPPVCLLHTVIFYQNEGFHDFSVSGSPTILVFWAKFHPNILSGSPKREPPPMVVWENSAIF